MFIKKKKNQIALDKYPIMRDDTNLWKTKKYGETKKLPFRILSSVVRTVLQSSKRCDTDNINIESRSEHYEEWVKMCRAKRWRS